MNYYDFETRVRYADTDKMGVSYYGSYLNWFEAARTEYFRALDYPYTECEKQGLYLPVTEAGIRYKKPSTYDDLLIVRTSVSQIRASSLRFEYQVLMKATGDVLATGFTVHVFVNEKMRPARVPEKVAELVTTHTLLP